jgi:hypothetical protein
VVEEGGRCTCVDFSVASDKGSPRTAHWSYSEHDCSTAAESIRARYAALGRSMPHTQKLAKCWRALKVSFSAHRYSR